jgi:DNA-binding beta-propeller fold protein YncE
MTIGADPSGEGRISRRSLLKGIGGGAVVASLGVGTLAVTGPTPTPATASLNSFAGRALLGASDGDMTATAYATGDLGRVPGIEDALSVLALPFDGTNPSIATVPVSNSVLAWPSIIAVSPDGRRAYVAETRARPADGVESVGSVQEDLPEGRLVTVVDITDPTAPSVVDSLDVGPAPGTVAVSPDGSTLAVGLDRDADQLVLIALDSETGALGTQTAVTVNPEDSTAATGVLNIDWHPSGRFLAANVGDHEIAFFRVERDSSELTLQPHGPRLTGGTRFSVGAFTPDGRHYLAMDVNWGTPPLGNLLNSPSELQSLRFDEGNSPEHEVVLTVETGLGSEGFALSTDGSLVVTVNMNRTYLPGILRFWPGYEMSSLSLLTVEANGQVTKIDEYPFEGLLPEDVVFDAAGEALAVTIYNYREETPRAGAIEFWNVVRGSTPRLERTSSRIEVARGVHALALVPNRITENQSGSHAASREGHGAPQSIPRVEPLSLTMVNAYLLMGDHPVLVDTGRPGDGPQILDGLERLGIEPSSLALILLTHGHSDHAGTAAELRELTGAPIAVHRADFGMIEQGTNDPVAPTGIEGRIAKKIVSHNERKAETRVFRRGRKPTTLTQTTFDSRPTPPRQPELL